MAGDWRFKDETLTDTLGAGGSSTHRAKGYHKAGTMNSTEKSFSLHLAVLKQVGEVLWWDFEAMKFQLGDGAWYTPDFNVMLKDCTLQMIDVKGLGHREHKKGNKGTGEMYEVPYFEEASRVRIIAVAARFPITFLVAYKSKDGNWIHQTMK